jgi:hypothetical protein
MAEVCEVRLVNVADRPEVIPAGVDVELGWVIWNAPRPLYGRVTWTGKFVAGVLYAAGPRDEYERLNAQQDAVEIVMVPNDYLATVTRQLVEADGHTLADYEEVDMGVGDVARHYGLPWHEEG